MDQGTRDFGSTSASANRALQDNLDRNQPRIVASYALIGAILLLGGVGFAIDRWAGTSPWVLLFGLAAGILLGFGQLLRKVREP
jgi:F0F1-type ATP synthase assembly protein I